MLSAVIIVLRETLEASLLVSFLFIYSSLFMISRKWIVKGLLSGMLLAIVVAEQLPVISDWYDGAGQEILFSIALFSLSLLIQSVNMLVMARHKTKIKSSYLTWVFFSIIVLAVGLEGAEIIIFAQSSLGNSEIFYSNLLGSVFGVGIGISVGAVSYYLLGLFKTKGHYVVFSLLVLLSAGMVSQGFSYLMQAGIIESGYPVWNSSSMISEYSVFGQLLYALIGYEATPSAIQVVFYFGYIILPFAIYIFLNRYWTQRNL
jgi:high-affinity iron transporter